MQLTHSNPTEDAPQAGGNQFNHGVWSDVAGFAATGAGITIASLDAPNFCPITADYPFGNPLPAGLPSRLAQLPAGSVRGMGVNLHNNLWNTNYPTFYPYYDAKLCKNVDDCVNADQRFRFRLGFSPAR